MNSPSTAMVSYSSPVRTTTSTGHSGGQCWGAITRSVAPTVTGKVRRSSVTVPDAWRDEDAPCSSCEEEEEEEVVEVEVEAKDLDQAVVAAVGARTRSRRADAADVCEAPEAVAATKFTSFKI